MPKNNKTPVSVKIGEAEGLVKLRELVLKEQAEHGLKCPVTDEFLVRFFRARKGDPYSGLEAVRAYHLEDKLLQAKLIKYSTFLHDFQVTSYYKMRDSVGNVKEKLTPEALRKFLESEMFGVLKERDGKGRPIVYFRTGRWNLDEITFEEFYLGCYLVCEELTSTEETQLNGIVAIVDHAGLSLNMIRKIAGQMSLTNIRRIIKLFQGAFPARFKEAHVINHPFIFDMLFRMGKPFMKEKLKRRVNEHGSHVENIQSSISPDILPKSLLGNVEDEECFHTDFYLDQLMTKNGHYKEMAKYGYF